MKAAFKNGRDIFLKDVELPPMQPHQVRLKVRACGVCGTDLHVRPGEDKAVPIGHEIAGTVLDVGSAVTGVEKGQEVALDSSTPCGRCEHCHNAEQELCTALQSFWSVESRRFAEEMLVPPACVLPAEGLDPAVACLQEPLGVAIDMVRLADIRIDSNVLVIGPGAIGLMVIALVKRAGARRVFVSGHRRRTVRAELALRFGADAFVDPTECEVEAHDFGCPIDRVLVTATPRTLPTAMKVAVKGGIISFIGIEYGEGALCTFDANEFHFKKLQLRASFASPALFGARALQYLREGVVDGEALVSHRVPLADIAVAIDTARDDPAAVKVVVTNE